MSTFSDAEVFSILAEQTSRRGHISVHELSKASGVSVGSLYHRYGSREALLARAWLEAVERFQDRFLAALAPGDLAAGEEAALATPRFCRNHRGEALLLACCRQSEFLGDDTPPALRRAIGDANLKIGKAMAAFASRHGLDPDTCRMAMIGFPLGAVRLYLPERNVPAKVDDGIRAAYRSLIPGDGAGA